MNSQERYKILKEKAKSLLHKGSLNDYLRVLRELAGLEQQMEVAPVHWN